MGPEQNSQLPSMLQSLKEVEPGEKPLGTVTLPRTSSPGRSQLLPFGEKNHSRSDKGQGEPVALVHQNHHPGHPCVHFLTSFSGCLLLLKVVGLTTDRDAVATPNFSTPGQNTGRHKSPLSIALLSRRFAKSEHVKYFWEPP